MSEFNFGIRRRLEEAFTEDSVFRRINCILALDTYVELYDGGRICLAEFAKKNRIMICFFS